jgi:hypothetical protein
LIGAFGAVQTAIAKPRKSAGNNDPNGWLWAYTATQGDKEESGTFRVRSFQVFKGEEKVGHIDPKGGTSLGDQSTLILTNFGKINGTVELVKTQRKPPVWTGTLKKEDGTEWHFKVKLIEK